jgi:hypothetical protein
MSNGLKSGVRQATAESDFHCVTMRISIGKYNKKH